MFWNFTNQNKLISSFEIRVFAVHSLRFDENIQDFQKTHFKETWSFWLAQTFVDFDVIYFPSEMMAVKQNKNQDLAILSTSVIKCAFCSYNTSYNSQVGIDFEYRFLARHYKTHTERDVRFACYGCDKLHYDISHVSTW